MVVDTPPNDVRTLGMAARMADHVIVVSGSNPLEAARDRAAAAVNAELTLLYWQVGRRISQEVLKGERAEYGGAVVEKVAGQLVRDYGRGFEAKNLRRMIQFADAYPEESIVVSLARQLTWTHFVALIPLKDPLQRDFYLDMARTGRWSVRTLREGISSMLYERTTLSKRPEETVKADLEALRFEGRLSADLLLKDPYLLDFLGLRDRFLERDLEDAILRELERFLLELGAGFSFVARQRRIQLDDDDFYIDLLLYNRKLRRLVAVDLKLGDFKAEYKGQMELYLRWLALHEAEEGEETPLGIILCAGKKAEQIELLELDKSGIHVAEYLTVLPPREELEARLRRALEAAREQLGEGESG